MSRPEPGARPEPSSKARLTILTGLSRHGPGRSRGFQAEPGPHNTSRRADNQITSVIFLVQEQEIRCSMNNTLDITQIVHMDR